MEWPQSGAAGFVAGNEEERSRLPWHHNAETRQFDSLIDLWRGDIEGRTTPQETVLFINVGSQGVQFASVAARVYELARERGFGNEMEQHQFLQNVRD